MDRSVRKHTLKFDPRTELLLLVMANVVAFITFEKKARKDGSSVLK